MKILICTPEYPPLYSSGIGNVVKCLKHELEKNGLSIMTCSTICSDIELGNGIISKRFINIRSLYVSYFWYKASIYVKKHADKYDLVWVHDPMPHFLSMFPKDRHLVITFHTVHSKYLYYSRYPKFVSRLIFLLEKHSLRNTSENVRIIAVSREVVRELTELAIPIHKIKYIPNGVDVDMFKPASNKKHLRKKLRLPEDGIILLSVGKLKEQKRPLVLIDVFSSIEKTIDNIYLVVIGKGHLLDEVKEYAENKVVNKIMFLGYVNDTSEYYAAADYYIMASSYEGQPLTLLEAMSSGLACIVSDIPNLEIVRDADCGIILSYEDPHSSANRIIEYISRNNSDHTNNARAYCLNNASWKHIAEVYTEEFKSILSRS